MVWINISFCRSSYHEDDWPFNRTIWNLCVKKVSLCFSGGPDIPVDCILCSTFVVWFLLSFYFFSFVLIDICFPSPFFSVVWHFFFFIDSFSVLLKLLAILTLSLPFCRLIFLFAWLYHFFFLLMSMMFLILSVTMFYKLFLISCSTTCFTLILLSLFILLCLFFDLLAMSLFPL